MQFEIEVKDESDETYTVVADPSPASHRPLSPVPREPTEGYRFYLLDYPQIYLRFSRPDKFISNSSKKVYRVSSQEGLETLSSLPRPR